jgi:class 3 adenylate cyclase
VTLTVTAQPATRNRVDQFSNAVRTIRSSTAVRAGLALVKAVAGLAPRLDLALQVRIWLATGLVVVGDLIGEGASREEAVIGGTPNLAARLQALAGPDSVVIAPGTHRLVAGLFELGGRLWRMRVEDVRNGRGEP